MDEQWVQDTMSVSHPREFRGVWVTTLFNLDWPTQPGLRVEQQQRELIEILDHLKELNFNALMLQIRPAGDAFYESELEPWSHWLTGQQGQAPDPLYDPLEFAIAECHKRSIELHAWFNPYRAEKHLQSEEPVVAVAPHMRVLHPESVYQYGSDQWMDPGARVVQNRIVEVILDVVKRYDVDGIHLDDYFYPYPQYFKSPDAQSEQEFQIVPFPDDQTYLAYRHAGGDLNKADWRRENVNTIIQRLSSEIRSVKQHVKFGISPFGIYRPGHPEGIQASIDTYEMTYSDPQKWLAEGWVDYLAPQLYWEIDPPPQSFPVLLNWWTEQNCQARHIYPGLALYKTDTHDWPIREIQAQVEVTRSYSPQLSLGNIFFRMGFLEDATTIETFERDIYPRPALAPVMPWKVNQTVVAPPVIVHSEKGHLRWQAEANCEVWRWTLYERQGDEWIIRQIFAAETQETDLLPGTYALCAVNRNLIESPGRMTTLE
jgi:uncharacterized lipoprotein YddW (UPF0748 family)